MKNIPAKYWAYVIILIVITLCFCNCHVNKNIQKTKTEEKVEDKTHTVTTRTVMETGSKVIETLADSLKSEDDLQPFINGEKITGEDEDIKFSIEVDPITKKIKTLIVQKPKKTLMTVNRVTAENVDEHKNVKSDIVIKEKEKTVVKDSGVNWNYLWWIIAGVIIAAFFYWFIFKRKKESS